jgi:hypothetical protein
MKKRCLDRDYRRFDRYGGRGITVCPEWIDSFESFLSDMGPRPSPDHSLDRRDNDGNYEPGNCRWATLKEQRRNTAANHLVTAFGETKTLAEWSESTGIERSKMAYRIKVGWPMERVMDPVDGRL